MSTKALTNPQAVGTDVDMKDKWLQVRVDDEIEQMILDLRRAEEDLPAKSKLIVRLIERAHAELQKGKKDAQ